MRALVAASLLAIPAWSPASVAAAIVDAGAVTTVAVETPLYDIRLGDAGGCDPAGCGGELSRDRGLTPGSRWSCKPSLGPAGSTCSILYTLGEMLDIVGINVAMYKGDTRTRALDVYVDDAMVTSWTSSGTTTDFENIELGATGQVVELRGVLADSEWLSITEVWILVDDGDTTDAVLASSLTTVTTSAPLYDTRSAMNGGCDPTGCTASNTLDGEIADTSRWSCAPKLGGTCSISYTLGMALDLSELRLALYKGATRVRTVEVHVDGVIVTTWTSSSTTDGFESINLSGTSGTTIEIVGVLADSEWLSIKETQIMVLPTNVAVLASSLTTVTTSAPLYDTRLAVDGGCDPNGCIAANTQDGKMADMSRWSCAPKLGGTCSISYTFGMALDLSELRLALYKGDTRVRTVEVYVDGTLVITWTSSGATDGFESIDLPATSGTMIEVVGVLAEFEWLSIKETEIMVFSDMPIEPTATPTPTTPGQPSAITPSPTPAPQPVTPGGGLQPVGLLPLVTGSGETLEKYYLRDGDLSTSWSCTGDPLDQYYDCSVYFDLYSYRHVKQVKIALPDDAGAVDMRITGSHYFDNVGETFVTSSERSTGFETYDFDVFTKTISISGVFSSIGQTITISEVEILEEVQPGEVLAADFDTPYDNGDGLWVGPTTGAFDWSSDTDEALDRTLSWPLKSYATMDAIEMQFPVGDTYKFDLELYDGGDDAIQVFSVQGLESGDAAGWQSFDLSGSAGEYVAVITLIIKGTGSGAPGFKLLNARFMGTPVDNPSDTFYVGSTWLDDWGSTRYPDFVANGSGDQYEINAAICAVKKADYDGVDCIGGDDTATGTVEIHFGEWFVDGSIFMKSGVFLNGRFSIDDSPYTTDIVVEEGANGNTDINAIVVMDGIKDARIDDLWIRGRYDPENDDAAVTGFGSVGLSIVGSSNITCIDTEVRYSDGDALVVRNSQNVNIDAGKFDEEYYPWTIGISRGTGILVDSSDAVWIRRHTVYNNSVAGIHIMGSNNFTFEATIADQCYGPDCVLEGEGNVGSLDGQQPIEVIIETSTDVKFEDMKVQSLNDPVMMVSASTGVSFDNCGFSTVESGTCVIKVLDTESEVATGGDPELSLQNTPEGPCWVKV